MHLTIPFSAVDDLQQHGKTTLKNERGDTVVIELDAVQADGEVDTGQGVVE